MDYKLIVLIYAAIISTIVFVWRLYEFYYDRVGKLKVKINKSTKIPVSSDFKFGEFQIYVITTVINIGKTKRLIEEPSFVCNIKVDKQKFFNFLNFTNTVKYPITLDSGEKFEYEIPIEEFEGLKSKGILKIKSHIRDTHGKSYYSKWYEI